MKKLKFSRKSFVIGLGLGILFGAGVFLLFPQTVIKDNPSTLTKQEIIEEARKLGMVHLLELDPQKFVLQNEEIIRRAKQLGMTKKAGADDQALTDVVTIIIPRGLGSHEISQILYKNQLIDSVEKFELFLMKNEATTKLQYGYHNIPVNGDYETILNVLLKKP